MSRFHNTYLRNSSIGADPQTIQRPFSTPPEPVAPPSSSPQSAGSPGSTTVFVGNLPKKYSKIELEKILRDLFAKYGTVLYTKANMDGKNRPYCFVKFADRTNFDQLFSDQILLDGRCLRLECANCSTPPAQPSQHALAEFPAALKLSTFMSVSEQCFDATVVYVDTFNPSLVCERVLKKYFLRHGSITKVKIYFNSFSTFALVRFEDRLCAQRAIFSENGKYWIDRTLRVELFREFLVSNPGFDGPLEGASCFSRILPEASRSPHPGEDSTFLPFQLFK